MNNKYKILIVEDDCTTRSFLTQLFESNGYRPLIADSCATAQMMFDSHLPDLVTLDLTLPDKDGTEFIKYVRRDSLVPIIVVTTGANEEDKVIAFDIGANDYVTKPFGSNELMARIRAALRNNRSGSYEGHLPGGRFILGDLAIDYDRRQVFVGEREIKLTQTEYNIIVLLSEFPGKTFTYQTIIKAVWSGDVDQRSIKKLQVNIVSIRKKLGREGVIINLPGVGYRIDN